MADLTKDFSAICLLETIAANVKNKKLSDKDFREFVYDSLPNEIKDEYVHKKES